MSFKRLTMTLGRVGRAKLALIGVLCALPLMAFHCTENVEPIGAGLTYYGSKDAGPCTQAYQMKGWRPTTTDPNAKLPLFLYFVGTQAINTGYTSGVADAITKAMAHRGFVALAVGWDSSVKVSDAEIDRKLQCLFNPTPAQPNLRTVACGIANVDCNSKGISVWGHSQGGLIAVRSAKYAMKGSQSLVRAVWATGVGTNVIAPAELPKNRLRVVNGANDFGNGSQSTLQTITGATKPMHCPGSPANECLRPGVTVDGQTLSEYTTGKDSGWVSVADSIPALGSGHCWFMNGPNASTWWPLENCADEAAPMPAFVDPAGTAPWSLEANADWAALTVYANPVP